MVLALLRKNGFYSDIAKRRRILLFFGQWRGAHVFRQLPAFHM